MLSLNTTIHVPGLTGREITDFLVNCDDAQYQAWWPGVHLHFHTLRRVPGDVGSVVYMDEYVGRFRLTEKAVVVVAVPGKELVLQFVHGGLRMPARLIMRFNDERGGVTISHTIEAGFGGVGRVFDPLLRFWFGGEFAEAMDTHVRTEFPRLRDLLRGLARSP
jgi:hypothetical protein